MYTHFVKTGIMSMEKLIFLLSKNARERFGISDSGFSVWELDTEYKVNPDDFLSKGRSTPFEGAKVCGTCLMTVYNGQTVYKK